MAACGITATVPPILILSGGCPTYRNNKNSNVNTNANVSSPSNVAGKWTLVESNLSEDCTPGLVNGTYTIAQNDSSITITNSYGSVYEGTVTDNRMEWAMSASGVVEGADVVYNISILLDTSGDTCSGSASWASAVSVEGQVVSCSATADLSGSREVGGDYTSGYTSGYDSGYTSSYDSHYTSGYTSAYTSAYSSYCSYSSMYSSGRSYSSTSSQYGSLYYYSYRNYHSYGSYGSRYGSRC